MGTMIDKSGVSQTTGVAKNKFGVFGDMKGGKPPMTVDMNKTRKSSNGEVEVTIEDVVREEELVTVETIIESSSLNTKSTGNQATNTNKTEEKKGKKVILRKQITIPGKSLADKLHQVDSPSNGEKLFKTFKRRGIESKDEGKKEASE